MELRMHYSNGTINSIITSDPNYGYTIEEKQITITRYFSENGIANELYNSYLSKVKDKEIIQVEMIDGEHQYFLPNITLAFYVISYKPESMQENIAFKQE